MYFPRELSEVANIYKNIDTIPQEHVYRILRTLPKTLSCINGYVLVAQCIINGFISWEELERTGELYPSQREKLQEIISIIQLIEQEEHSQQYIVSPDAQPYKNLYIFLLSHPNNGSTVGNEIFSRINFLDKMTRDVIFTIPGYSRAGNKDSVVNLSDNNMPLTFDENVFIDIITNLEDKSNGRFLYKDACELLFVGTDADGEYDFTDMVRLDLNLLAKKRKINPIELIMTVSQRFRSTQDSIDINKYITQILGELTMHEELPTKKVFIAGSKLLETERALLREELNKIENTLNIDIRSLTFEDFPMSLTGENKGRQADYNNFIRNDADIVIFIFDFTAGEITKEEFEVAYEALIENKRPEIFVFVRKRNILLSLFLEHKIKDIKQKVFASGKEYYIEYNGHDNLRYLFYKAMTDYFKLKLNNNQIS